MWLKLLMVLSMLATMFGAIAPLMSQTDDQNKIQNVKHHLIGLEMKQRAEFQTPR